VGPRIYRQLVAHQTDPYPIAVFALDR
jgi:hypothetical protein